MNIVGHGRGEKTIKTLNHFGSHFGRANFLATLFFFWALSWSAFATEIPDKKCTNGALPTFTNYAVQVQNAQNNPKRPKLKFNNEFSRMFKTRLSDGLDDNPIDFAGHYVFVSFGCGTGCLYGGYVDVKTGQAVELPFSVSSPLAHERHLIEKKADSRLFIVNGYLSEDEEEDNPARRYFFVLQNNHLKPICYAPLDDDATF